MKDNNIFTRKFGLPKYTNQPRKNNLWAQIGYFKGIRLESRTKEVISPLNVILFSVFSL